MKLIELDTTDSTNLETFRLLKSKVSERIAVVARSQSGGIGRDGRHWKSPTGGLWMSIGWLTTKDDPALRCISLVAGAIISEVLDHAYHVSTFIKWPNDLLVANRKLCGILCQTQSFEDQNAVVVGIGMNVNNDSRELGDEMRTPPISLIELTGSPVNVSELCQNLTSSIADGLEKYQNEGFEPFYSIIEKRLAWRGESVSWESSRESDRQNGILQTISHEGALILQIKDQQIEVSSGEISKLAVR